jgi:glycogen debranching enzyme
MAHIENTLLPSLKLYEFYVLDVATHKKEFQAAWSKSKASASKGNSSLSSKSIEEQAQAYAQEVLPTNWSNLGKRFHATPDYSKAVNFVASLLGLAPSAESSEQATETFAKLEDVLNVERYQQFDQDKKAILDNTSGRIKYTRLEEHGPKKGEITAK